MKSTEMTPILDYEAMVRTYRDSLTTVLRGFRPGDAPFLDTWVPDDDHHLSLLSLIEAAESSGVANMSVYLGPETLQSLDFERLDALTQDVADLHTETQGDGTLLHVAARQPECALDIHPVYVDRLREVLRQRRSQRPLVTRSGMVPVQASLDGMSLEVLVDPMTHTVRDAAYWHASSDVQVGLLEALCSILPGLTIAEVADHAAIRLEYSLRDRSQPRPVAGVVTPENAHPALASLRRLLRLLAAEYRAKHPVQDKDNFFDLPASASWLALSEDTQLERLREGVAVACANLELDCSDVVVVSLDDDVKVTLDLTGTTGELPSGAKGSLLMKIEAHLVSRVEPKLQVYARERKDLNKIRRLVSAGAGSAS